MSNSANSFFGNSFATAVRDGAVKSQHSTDPEALGARLLNRINKLYGAVKQMEKNIQAGNIQTGNAPDEKLNNITGVAKSIEKLSTFLTANIGIAANSSPAPTSKPPRNVFSN